MLEITLKKCVLDSQKITRKIKQEKIQCFRHIQGHHIDHKIKIIRIEEKKINKIRCTNNIML